MTYPLFCLSFNIHFNIPPYQGHVFICTFASTYYNDKHHHAKNIKHNKEVVGRGDEALLQGHAPRGVAIICLALFYATGLTNYNILSILPVIAIFFGIAGYVKGEKRKSLY